MIDLEVKKIVSRKNGHDLEAVFKLLRDNNYKVSVDEVSLKVVQRHFDQEKSKERSYLVESQEKRFFPENTQNINGKDNCVHAVITLLINETIKKKLQTDAEFRLTFCIGPKKPVFWIYAIKIGEKIYCNFNLHDPREVVFGGDWRVVQLKNNSPNIFRRFINYFLKKN